ncbi:Histone-lysine N-methyltransferase set9 [Mortierella sp. AD094]|nr:Histone-lysine N-methyltransferase set9 [Mortierella sp. AD094]
MDLQTLSTLDDLMSDILLDGINLWFQTHKMNKDYRPLRLPTGKVLDIIQRRVIVDRKVPEAVKDLLEIEPIKKLFKTDKEIQDFTVHARRYLNIYLPTAGFEISQTDRYSAVTNKSEACVIANRPFEVGFELRYCAGTIAILNEQEERDLENRTSDFSVIKTSRKGTCLFLGPARFVNHDCDPNCSFMSAGANVIYFKVLKQINVNDEITTHYGDNYFGTNNQECLCATCERLCQGGYKKSKGAATETPLSPTLKPVREGPPSRRLRNRQNVNYYPTLLSRPATKQNPAQLQTPPKTTSPPVESDTIPSTSGPLTPISQRDLESTEELEQTEQTEEIISSLSDTTQTDIAVDESSYDRECELMLAASMRRLIVSEPGPELEPALDPAVGLEPEQPEQPNLEPEQPEQPEQPDLEPEQPDLEPEQPKQPEQPDLEPEFEQPGPEPEPKEPEQQQPQQQQKESIDNMTAETGKNVESDSLSTGAGSPSFSPKNFRMSIDFLCHSSARAPALNIPNVAVEDDDNRVPDDISEHESEVVPNNQTPKGTNRTPAKEAIDPLRCENCKDAISKHELSPSSTCRRCHRHFTIYGIPWPSRSNQAIVAKLRKAEREAAMKLKAVQNALEAERLKKKKIAAEAAKAAMKASAAALGQSKSTKKKGSKSSKTSAQMSMMGLHYRPPGMVMPYHREPYTYSLNDQTSEEYSRQRYRAFIMNYGQSLSARHNSNAQDHLRCDFSSIITDDHPFHHAPYVVFVDPQDGEETNYWWIAVTVPRSQIDPSMPEIGKRNDDTRDPDLIVVRFLEDFKYSVCNISGLKLFHPDQDPYRGYVNTYGRDFIKNLGVKRALAFLNGDVPTELQWRDMSCDNQLSLPEVAMVTRRIEIQIEDEQFRVQQLRNRQLHYQALYQQYQEHPDSLMPGHSLGDFRPQEELYGQDYYSLELRQQQYQQQYQAQWEDQDNQSLSQQQYLQQYRVRFDSEEQALRFLEENEPNSLNRQRMGYIRGVTFQDQIDMQQSGFSYGSQDEDHQLDEVAQFLARTSSSHKPPKRKQGARGLGKKTLAKLLELQIQQGRAAIEAAELGGVVPPITQSKRRSRAKAKAADFIQAGATADPQEIHAVDNSTILTPTPVAKKGSKRGSKKSSATTANDKTALTSVPVPRYATTPTPAPVVTPKKAPALPKSVTNPAVTLTDISFEESGKPKIKKSRSKLSSVIWWKTSVAPYRAARLKPRSENENPQSYCILPSSIPSRFKSLSNLLEPQQLPEVPSSIEDQFEVDYKLLEWRILEGMQDSSSGDLGNSPTTKPARRRKTGVAPSSKSNTFGSQVRDNTDNRCDIDDIGSSESSETLSLPPSYNTSTSSSLLPSTACSVFGDDDNDIDIVGLDDNVEIATTRTTKRTPGGSDSQLVSKKRSHKRSAPTSIPDFSAGLMFPNAMMPIAEKDPRVSNKRKKTKKNANDKAAAAISPPGNAAVASTSATANHKGRVTELDRLQEWTIKNSLPSEGAGTLRNRSLTSTRPQQPLQPQLQHTAPVKKQIKSELERLQQWTILNSLPVGETGNIEEALNDKLTTRSGRKRSREQRDGVDLTAIEESPSSKRNRTENYPVASSLASTMESPSTVPIASTADPTATRSPESATSKSKKKAAQQPVTDIHSAEPESPAEESSTSTDLAAVLAESKELQQLMQWAIRDSTIPIDLESNVRSVRSRTKAITQDTPTLGTSATETIAPSTTTRVLRARTGALGDKISTSTAGTSKISAPIAGTSKTSVSIAGTSETDATKNGPDTKIVSRVETIADRPGMVILHIPPSTFLSGILNPPHQDTSVEEAATSDASVSESSRLDVSIEKTVQVAVKKGRGKSKSFTDGPETKIDPTPEQSEHNPADCASDQGVEAIDENTAIPEVSRATRRSKNEKPIASIEAEPTTPNSSQNAADNSAAAEPSADVPAAEKPVRNTKQSRRRQSAGAAVAEEALALVEFLSSKPISSAESSASSSTGSATDAPVNTDETEEVAQNTRSKDALRSKNRKAAESAEISPTNDSSPSSPLATSRARRSETAKKPNTAIPKFKVGDEVRAPAEENELYDARVRAIRDHKKLNDVYEYHVHYHGYGSRFDAWIEERLLVRQKK